MSELQTIISYLNQPPFEQNLTLVSFDSKLYTELIELLIIVLYEIDPSQKDELDPLIDSDQFNANLLNCLKLLNYPPIREEEAVFNEQFENENRDLICNILYWLLTKQTELKTRAYIAKYLKPFDLPQEFLVDPILFDLLEDLKKHKIEFKNTHKELMTVTNGNINNENNSVDSFKQEIKQLTNEKEQLISKLSKMKDKSDGESLRFADGDSNKCKQKFSELLELTSLLRKAQEEEVILFETGNEQRKELNINSKYIQNLIDKKNNLQLIMESNDILNSLNNKINSTKLVLNKLNEEYTENEHILNETLLILNGNTIYNENDCINLENDINIIEKEVNILEKQRDQILETIDSKLGFYKKRAIGVTKKKNDAIKRLNNSKNELIDLRSEIIKLDKEMDKMSVNGRRAMRENELKQYMQQLRIKTEKYKKCKIELQNKRNELINLQNINEELRLKDDNYDEYLEMKDNEIVIQKKRNELQKVSAMKNEIDIKKENKLQNLSQIVEKINYILKQKKSKLQPLVKQLKEKRNEFQMFENKYFEKKRIYENMRIGTDSELNKLENNVNCIKKMVNNLETKYESIKTQIEINNIRLEKVKMEEKYQNNNDVLDKQFKCYRDLYDEEINKLLHLSKSLRNKQNEIREKHQNNIMQKQYFIQLKELLQFKLNIVQNRVNEMQMLNIDTQNDEDRLVFD